MKKVTSLAIFNTINIFALFIIGIVQKTEAVNYIDTQIQYNQNPIKRQSDYVYFCKSEKLNLKNKPEKNIRWIQEKVLKNIDTKKCKKNDLSIYIWDYDGYNDEDNYIPLNPKELKFWLNEMKLQYSFCLTIQVFPKEGKKIYLKNQKLWHKNDNLL